MAAVFSMQGIGQLFAAIVALIVTTAFGDIFKNAKSVAECDYDCQTAADRCWRIIIGVGAVPAVFALYYRITIPETPRYTFEVARDVEKAAADIKAYVASQSEGEVDEVKQARMKKVASPALNIPSASWRDAYQYFSQWKNAKVLIATTLSWFFLVRKHVLSTYTWSPQRLTLFVGFCFLWFGLEQSGCPASDRLCGRKFFA